VVHRRGGPEAMSVDRVSVPQVQAEEVLVRVRACGLSLMDIWARTGPPQPIFPWKESTYPRITGCDVAGEVAEVGRDVTSVSVGDRVVVYPALSCGACDYCYRGEQSMCPDYRIFGEHTQGGFAEFVTAPAVNLEEIPGDLDFRTAGSIPSAFTTAWRMVVTAGQIMSGEDVLVLAAGGAIGVAAMQIALHAGARVLAGATTEEKRRRAVSLGATAAVDHATPFSDWVLERTCGRGVDIVVDSLGSTWPESIRSLARGGRLVCCGATLGNKPQFDIRELYQRHRSIRGGPLGNRGEFNHILRIIGQRAIIPVIDSVFPLGDIHKAHARLEGRESFGRIVVDPSAPE